MDQSRHPGASWWRVDLHAHSPSSYDFGAGEGQVSTSRPSVDDWLLAYMTSSIDALVIADHNSHEGIDIARARMDALRESDHPQFRELVLFPGVEITTAGGLHLLAVFDPSEPSETVNGLLYKCEFRGARGTSNRTTRNSFIEVLSMIHQEGGIPIPAHVDGRAGLLHDMAPNELATVLETKLVSIVEVAGADTSAVESKGWIPVLGSDSHHLDASGAPDRSIAKFPGSHFTWVKMGSPNLMGLRSAFSDGKSSLVRSIDDSSNQNLISHNAIHSVEIKQSNETTSYRFSPWMNALIGGRGTGKSTIVEVLRLVMDRFGELSESMQQDLEWFSPSPSANSDGRMWDSSTKIIVRFSRADSEYRVVWSGEAPNSRIIEVLDGEDWVQEDGSVSERFPLLVSSQKQMFEMAKKPQALLTLVDSLTDVDYLAWHRQFDELRTRYRTNRSTAVGIEDQLSDESAIRGNLIDAERDLQALQQLRDSPAAQALDAYLAQAQQQDSFDLAAKAAIDALHQTLAQFALATEELELSEPIDEVESGWRALVQSGVDDIRVTDETLRQGLESYESERARIDPRANALTRLREAVAALLREEGANEPEEQDEYVDIVDRDTQDDQDRPNPYELALQRHTACSQAVQSLDLLKSDLREQNTEGSNILTQIGTARADLFERRKRALSRLTSGTIELKVHQFADTSRIEGELRLITQRPSSFDSVFDASGIRQILVSDPRSPQYLNELEVLKSLLRELRRDGRSSPILSGMGTLQIDPRFITHLQNLDEFEFEVAVDLWFPDDLLEVRYSDTPGAPRRPISQGSPGQRTAALLAVMMKLGDQPLVLDQPEDDIDNLLIYDLVVKTLKSVKTNRQVIVATHNGNIVVNGDAELVTVMQHASVPQPTASGAIQEDTIRDLICRILEGGELAFEARYKRLIPVP